MVNVTKEKLKNINKHLVCPEISSTHSIFSFKKTTHLQLYYSLFTDVIDSNFCIHDCLYKSSKL